MGGFVWTEWRAIWVGFVWTEWRATWVGLFGLSGALYGWVSLN